MSQSPTRKRRFALQIIIAIWMVWIGAGCSSIPHQQVVHPSVGESAKTLRFNQIIDKVGLGSGDVIKWLAVGDDQYDFQQPFALDVRDQWMYVTDIASGLILRYHLEKQRAEIIWGAGDQVLGEAMSLYIDKDFSFYVTDTDGRRALHFSEGGDLLGEYRHDPNIARPIGIAVDQNNGHVLIADELYSHIVAFNAQGGEPIYGLGGRGEGPGKFRIITDFLQTDEGYLVGDRVELRIQELDKEGQYVTNFGQGVVTFPTAIAKDDYGRVFVADKTNSRIQVFKEGELIDTVGKNGDGKGEFRYISDMKYAANRLYVADNLNGRIQVFEVLPENQGAVALQSLH